MKKTKRGPFMKHSVCCNVCLTQCDCGTLLSGDVLYVTPDTITQCTVSMHGMT